MLPEEPLPVPELLDAVVLPLPPEEELVLVLPTVVTMPELAPVVVVVTELAPLELLEATVLEPLLPTEPVEDPADPVAVADPVEPDPVEPMVLDPEEPATVDELACPVLPLAVLEVVAEEPAVVPELPFADLFPADFPHAAVNSASISTELRRAMRFPCPLSYRREDYSSARARCPSRVKQRHGGLIGDSPAALNPLERTGRARGGVSAMPF